MSEDRFFAFRACPFSAECAHENERGWRLVVAHEPGSVTAYIREERVLPERVMRPDANRILVLAEELRAFVDRKAGA
jgi:hypothetical protein